MSAAAVALPRARAFAGSRAADALLLATAFCVTFEKVHWQVAGAVGLADVLTILFLAAYASQRARDWRVDAATASVLGFFAAFLVVYLVGYFNLETHDAFAQFGKGMIKFALHFGFLLAAVDYLTRRSPAFYWRALGLFRVRDDHRGHAVVTGGRADPLFAVSSRPGSFGAHRR